MTSDEILADRLRGICQRRNIRDVAVCVLARGESFCASVDGAGNDSAELTVDSPVYTGCLSKALTATLIAQLVSVGKLSLEQAVLEPFDELDTLQRRVLGGITIRQLLNHTHGLDDSALPSAPRLPGGQIDLQTLCHQLQTTKRIATPGQLFCYANVGYWLAAALLERVCGQPYEQLLNENLLVPLAMTRIASEAAPEVCPSSGSQLALSSRDLMQLLQFHLSTSPAARACASLRVDPVGYPGWCPTNRGAACGWNDYGDGWFGHNSVIHNQSSIVRLNPRKQAAISIASRTVHGYTVLGALFGNTLPEFRLFMPRPKILADDDLRRLLVEPYLGTFENSAIRLSIERGPNARLPLKLRAYDKRGAPRKPLLLRNLRPAEDGVFFTAPAHRQFFFVQFVAQPAQNNPPMIWNGSQLWSKS